MAKDPLLQPVVIPRDEVDVSAQEPQVPSTLRLILALVTFVGTLLAAVYFVVGRPTSSTKGQATATDRAKEPATEAQSPFFYSTVGHTPPTLAGASDNLRVPGKDSFTLEIKVATSRDEAERIIDDLHERGVEAYYTPLTRSGQLVYRIRQGLFANQKDADRAAATVQKRYALAARVVKLQ